MVLSRRDAHTAINQGRFIQLKTVGGYEEQMRVEIPLASLLLPRVLMYHGINCDSLQGWKTNIECVGGKRATRTGPGRVPFRYSVATEDVNGYAGHREAGRLSRLECRIERILRGPPTAQLCDLGRSIQLPDGQYQGRTRTRAHLVRSNLTFPQSRKRDPQPKGKVAHADLRGSLYPRSARTDRRAPSISPRTTIEPRCHHQLPPTATSQVIRVANNCRTQRKQAHPGRIAI